jgi:oligopeptide transport system substrate-binding protein
MQKFLLIFLFLLVIPLFAEWNNPYSQKEDSEKIIYRSFSAKPRTLDPAISYVSNEWAVVCQIYEQLFQYQFLKRPFELEPLLAETLPTVKYIDEKGDEISDPDSFDGKINSIWKLKLKKGIKYQNHPCFTKNESGAYLYHDFKNQNKIVFSDLFDLPNPSTREVTIKDFVFQIYRLADSRNHCPIISIVDKIKGMDACKKGINTEIEAIRKTRIQLSRDKGELIYNREEDEKTNPIILDYFKIPCEGINIIDDYNLEITLSEKYPQFQYWLSMPFFCPMPWEAISFYQQNEVKSKGFTLQTHPVGTGPFKFDKSNRNSRMILSRNENFHDEYYPKEASPKLQNLLGSAGSKLPLADKVIWTKEPEVTSQWIKFQQGYFDISAIPEQSFAGAIDLNVGSGELSQEMKSKKMNLIKATSTTIWYLGFNMLDPVVGGYSEDKQKLRQAISIAVDISELIKIFLNGRGVIAHSPLPPGIFGYDDPDTEKGLNKYIYDWDDEAKKEKSKGIEYAKNLLSEAGYPNGVDKKTGKQLVLFFDTTKMSATTVDWYKSQFAKLNIALEIKETDFNRYMEKLEVGDVQIFRGGWNADYPDPENFLFLLCGDNGRVKHKGENGANYENPEFDKLFHQIKSMENSPKRLELINQAIEIVRKDAPWHFNYYPIDFVLFHHWYENIIAGGVINNSLKYQNIHVENRNTYRQQYNKPLYGWPLSISIAILLVFFLPIYRFLKKEMS